MPPPVALAAAGDGWGRPPGLEDMRGQAGPVWNEPPGLTVQQWEHSNLLLKRSCPLLCSLAAKTRCLQWYFGWHVVLCGSPPASIFFTMPALSWVPGSREKRAQAGLEVWPAMMADSHNEQCR